MLGSKLATGSSVLRLPAGRSRRAPGGAHDDAPAGREAEPVLPFQRGFPPAARWAAARRPRAGQPIHSGRSSRNQRPHAAVRRSGRQVTRAVGGDHLGPVAPAKGVALGRQAVDA